MENFANENILNDDRLEIILNENNEENPNLRIGDRAPMFVATSTLGPIKLSDFLGKWVILFSHPGDYTPVCTTEFIALAKMYPEFVNRNAELLGLSIDSNPSHLAWINDIHKSTGIQIPFPVIADRDMKIAKKYGMIAPNASTTQTVRSVFFIDPEQNIRAILQYPMTSGRNTIELLRLLDSLQTTDSEHMATPVNWILGQPTILPSPNTYNELVERINTPTGYNTIDWYLSFNKPAMPNSFMEKNSFMNNTKKLNTKENLLNK